MHRPTGVIGRVRAHLTRADWPAAARGELDRALREIDLLERRARPCAAALGEPVLELRRRLEALRRARGGGFRRAASLL
jgi:hypothetical protein